MIRIWNASLKCAVINAFFVEKRKLTRFIFLPFQTRPSIQAVKLYGKDQAFMSLKDMGKRQQVYKLGGKSMKDLEFKYPLQLQLFAEGDDGNAGDPAGNDGNDGNDGNSASDEGGEKKYSEKEVNAIIDRKFAKWKTEQEKAEAEAKRLAEMNAQQRAEAERDKVQKELEELKAEKVLSEMTNEARKMCAEHDINVTDELLKVLVNPDTDVTKKAVDSFISMFESEVEKSVKERLKGNGPKRPASKNMGITRDSIMNISDPVERQRMIAENMDLFQ